MDADAYFGLVEPTTLDKALERACSEWASRPALLCDGQTVTYRELGDEVDVLASTYRRLGIAPSDRLVCWLPNGPEHLIAALAAWRVGAVHVGADLDLPASQLAWRLRHCGAAALVAPPDDLTGDVSQARSAAIRDVHSDCLKVVETDRQSRRTHVMLSVFKGDHPGGSQDQRTSPLDPAVIFYTSGTTATPKGVVRCHGPLARAWIQSGEGLGATPDDVHLVQLPLAHGFGFGMAIMGLLTGGRLVLLSRFSAETALNLIGSERVTILHGTPAHFDLLTTAVDVRRHDVTSLRVGRGSGAPFPSKLLARIFDDLGMDLVLVYGSSEGLGWTTTDREEMLAGAVGRPRPDLVRVVSPHGETLPTSEIGEILLRHRGRFRYWGEPEPAAGDAWHHTGDLGRIDAEGRLFVLGRLHYQVNRGGIRIDPGEVEEALADLPLFRESAVVGVPDDVLGEIVCVCAVAPNGTQPRLVELRDALSMRLARHKLPEQLSLVDKIPRTNVGKIDRVRLRTMALRGTRSERLRGG